MGDLRKLGGDSERFLAKLAMLRQKHKSEPTNEPTSTDSAPSPVPSCPQCRFPIRDDAHGWLRRDLPLGHPDWGQYGPGKHYVPCPSCANDDWRQRNHWHRMRALLGTSRLPTIAADWSFDRFPQAAGKATAVATVASWARGEIPDARQLYISGPFGVGKTGLAICALRAFLERHKPAVFWALPDLLSHIKATYRADADTSEDALLKQLRDVDLLVLDDLGAEKPSEWQRQVLYQIVNGRVSDDRETIYTSNIDLDDLHLHLGERIVERVIYRVLPVELGGINLRRQA